MEQTMNSNMQPAKRGIKKSWIILGIIVVLVLWMFSGYNGLVEKQELATTELANVQTQYQRRADRVESQRELQGSSGSGRGYGKPHQRGTSQI